MIPKSFTRTPKRAFRQVLLAVVVLFSLYSRAEFNQDDAVKLQEIISKLQSIGDEFTELNYLLSNQSSDVNQIFQFVEVIGNDIGELNTQLSDVNYYQYNNYVLLDILVNSFTEAYDSLNSAIRVALDEQSLEWIKLGYYSLNTLENASSLNTQLIQAISQKTEAINSVIQTIDIDGPRRIENVNHTILEAVQNIITALDDGIDLQISAGDIKVEAEVDVDTQGIINSIGDVDTTLTEFARVTKDYETKIWQQFLDYNDKPVVDPQRLYLNYFTPVSGTAVFNPENVGTESKAIAITPTGNFFTDVNILLRRINMFQYHQQNTLMKGYMLNFAEHQSNIIFRQEAHIAFSNLVDYISLQNFDRTNAILRADTMRDELEQRIQSSYEVPKLDVTDIKFEGFDEVTGQASRFNVFQNRHLPSTIILSFGDYKFDEHYYITNGDQAVINTEDYSILINACRTVCTVVWWSLAVLFGWLVFRLSHKTWEFISDQVIKGTGA